MPESCKLIDLKVRGDARGSLIAIEQGPELPFAVQRVYYIYGTVADTARGFHAHHALQQLAICVAGSCTMVVDDGSQRCEVLLDRPDRGLQIGSPIWREMHDFSPDCVLLVLASEPYDEADYIRDYQAFRQIVGRGSGDMS
nr:MULTISPECIES: FdtA/QdtA family cupin domain-containing protein [unclassified Sphingomonas]